MGTLFVKIYDFFVKRRKWLFALFILSSTVLLYFSTRLKLQENFMQMLPKDQTTKRFTGFLETSKFSDRILLCISNENKSGENAIDNMVSLSDSLVLNLRSEFGNYIQSIDYTANDSAVSRLFGVIDNNLPIFLEEKDYQFIDSLTHKEGIKKQVQHNYNTLTGPAGIALKKFIVKDPLGLNFIAYKKLSALQGDGDLGLYSQHFVTKDQKHVLIFIDPKYSSKETSKNAEFFEKLDNTIASFEEKSNGAKIIYFGAPAVASANATQIRKDTILTISLTIIALLLIISLFFRRWTKTLLMMVPVVYGGLFATAAIYLIKGEISVISLAAGSLILGVAINYSLHFLTHFKHDPDVKNVIKELANPLTIGSLTTIGGFLCLQFVKAPVLRDLGLFAALSLIGAALATLIFLPHFVNSKSAPQPEEEKESRLLNKIFSLTSNKYLKLSLLVLTPIFLFFASKVKFETDMNKINYLSDKLKESQQTLNQITSFYQKSVFVISSGNTLDEALVKNESVMSDVNKLKKEQKILNFSGASTVLFSNKEQQARIDRWNKFWTTERKQNVINNLKIEGSALHFKETAFEPVKTLLDKNFQPLSDTDSRVFQEGIMKNFIEKNGGKVSVITLVKSKPENVQEVTTRLTQKGADVFDREYITKALVNIVGDDFNFITLFSSLLVFTALLLTYGRIELVLITFLPMVISWIWILGIMAIFGFKFNIINIILSTLVFALGDDYCIFTTDGLQQEYSRKVKSISSVRTSILLSAITTIVGLGVLIFAKHPALNSIAFVSITGIVCVWLVSQCLQPILFDFLIRKPAEKGVGPYTFFKILKSAFAFIYFAFGAILLNLIGITLFKLYRGKAKRRKAIYSWVISRFARSLVYIMFNVKKKIINNTGEDFHKPAVVIANHQSFLDILMMVMIHPKCILITNNWVWNSWLFGPAVRMADYVLADNAESSIDQLKQKVDDGYSIIIFPEGTRSTDGNIKRFHKGAFYLAELLKIDVLPIILHGTGDTMKKNDFLLKDGQITAKILPRIGVSENKFGIAYKDRAKYVGRYFREEYHQLSNELENPDYYKNLLIENYLYKGPVLEWYMKVKVSLEKNYKLFDELIPKKGKVLDIGCGYGFLSNMLSYTSNERTVVGMDYDEEKIAVAQNACNKKETTNFYHANALTFQFEQYESIVLSDVLHYLTPDDQVNLLEKCVNSLNPGGVMIVRDGIKDLKKKHFGTQLTEVFSTKILKFNKTASTGLSFISSELMNGISAKYSLSMSKYDRSQLTSNVIYVFKKST